MKNFSQFIRAKRGNSTQESFARRWGLCLSTLQKWEIGRRQPTRLTAKLLRDRLARVRGTTVKKCPVRRTPGETPEKK